jgi:hypothetical protein
VTACDQRGSDACFEGVSAAIKHGVAGCRTLGSSGGLTYFAAVHVDAPGRKSDVEI